MYKKLLARACVRVLGETLKIVTHWRSSCNFSPTRACSRLAKVQRKLVSNEHYTLCRQRILWRNKACSCQRYLARIERLPAQATVAWNLPFDKTRSTVKCRQRSKHCLKLTQLINAHSPAPKYCGNQLLLCCSKREIWVLGSTGHTNEWGCRLVKCWKVWQSAVFVRNRLSSLKTEPIGDKMSVFWKNYWGFRTLAYNRDKTIFENCNQRQQNPVSGHRTQMSNQRPTFDHSVVR